MIDVDQLREFEQLILDSLSRGWSLAVFAEHISEVIAAKELHVMRPDLGVDEVVEDIRKFLWEEKRK